MHSKEMKGLRSHAFADRSSSNDPYECPRMPLIVVFALRGDHDMLAAYQIRSAIERAISHLTRAYVTSAVRTLD